MTFAVPLAGFSKAFDGAPIDPKVLEEQQKKLQEELQKKSDELRKRLEQATSSVAPSTAPTPPSTPPSGTVAMPPTSAPAAQLIAPAHSMIVSALTAKDLMGAQDDKVGDIERVVESNADKKSYLVASRGGFFGLFETEVLVPLENVTVQGGRILLRDLTVEQLKALPKYTSDGDSYQELEGTQMITLSELK